MLQAYVDEAGAGGLARSLTGLRDNEFGLMCAILFNPTTHAQAIQMFTPPFETFRNSMPLGAKLHITNAFQPGNEKWRKVAEEVRETYLQLIAQTKPVIIYAVRSLRLSRLAHLASAESKKIAQESARSAVKISDGNRPSDSHIEDDLMVSLAIHLDASAEIVDENIGGAKQVELHFAEIDITSRYESVIQQTREISTSVALVRG